MSIPPSAHSHRACGLTTITPDARRFTEYVVAPHELAHLSAETLEEHLTHLHEYVQKTQACIAEDGIDRAHSVRQASEQIAIYTAALAIVSLHEHQLPIAQVAEPAAHRMPDAHSPRMQ